MTAMELIHPAAEKLIESLPAELRSMHRKHNGGLLFSGALWVFTAENIVNRKYANNLDADQTPFAADAFGDLFSIADSAVYKIEPETGAIEAYAPSLKEWVHKIGLDPNVEVGEGFLIEWEKQHGRLQDGYRLFPLTPFVMGGKFDHENIKSVPLTESLDFRRELASTIKDLPDGARLLINPTDDVRNPV